MHAAYTQLVAYLHYKALKMSIYTYSVLAGISAPMTAFLAMQLRLFNIQFALTREIRGPTPGVRLDP